MFNADDVSLKDILTATSPFIKSLIDVFVTPKLTSLRDKAGKGTSTSSVPSEKDFMEYYHRTFKRLILLNTLVFRNAQRFLTDVYIPLTITSTNNRKCQCQILGYPKQMSDEFGNILITDTAGMGKSTLMKIIFIDIVRQNHGIPLFIELRRLSKEKKIIDEISEQIKSLGKALDSTLLFKLLEEGQFIILLDGFDEISLLDRESVTADLQDFINKASNNRFFITSRPEKALASFGNFQEFKIDPLSKKEAFQLLKKYDNSGIVSTLLIKKLQETDMRNIEEFLTNPLLVSLLFTAFEHKQAIPFKKYLFYRQVFDANFENHDLTKGESFSREKYSKLEIDDFHRVLRHIGFNCFKIQRIEFTKDELLKLILDAKIFCVGLEFNESEFLEDIIKTVPLFAQDGNYYRWSHKSLQEYFAAQFVFLDSKDKQEQILRRVYEHKDVEKYMNVLDLYYDMDYKTFRNVIELLFLEDYKSFKDKNYNSVYPGIDNDTIIHRRELLFLANAFLFKAKRTGKKSDIDNERLNELLKSVAIEHGLNANRLEGILLDPRLYDIYGLHYSESKASFLWLFARKNNTIIKNIQETIYALDEDCLVNFQFAGEYEAKHITDAVDDPLNNPDSFGIVNALIAKTRFIPFTIDENIALRELESIKNQIGIETESGFLDFD